MPRSIELIFDFVSPNAYLIWHPMRVLAEKHGVRLDVTPVFLAGMHRLTGNAPPMIRDAEVKGKNEYAMLEIRRFIARHGLEAFRMNPNFPFNSVALQRMLVVVDGEERNALIEALLPAIWEQGLDISDAGAIGAALSNAGFDGESLLAKTQEPGIKQALIDTTQAVVDRGAFGIPTMFVGEEMFFGKERLGQIAELLSASD